MISTDKDYACVIENKLYYGNSAPAKDESILRSIGVNSIVDLINYPSKSEEIKHSPEFHLFHLDVEDIPTNNVDWCEEPSKFIDQELASNNIVYVHCAQGISRSSTLIIYYLMTRKKQKLFETFQQILSIRPVCCPNFGFMKGLSELDAKLYNETTFSPEDYSLHCLTVQFPKISKDEIFSVYKETKEEFLQNEDQYKELAASKNIEPIGFNTIDRLIEKFGRKNIIRRVGCSFHHPFD